MNRENSITTLDKLAPGDFAVILSVTADEGMKRRLCDLGFCRGETVSCEMVSPLGDPHAYLIRGALIALRNSDARGISVE